MTSERTVAGSIRPVGRTIRHQTGSTLLGIFIGLVIGVVVAAGLVWYLNKTPAPFQDKGVHPAPAAPATANGPAQAGSPVPGTPESLPGKPGDKPRFEFYNILPGKQDAAPASPDKAATKPEDKPAVTEQIYLQAGAFQKTTDADNLKAKLALMGVEANVQEVSVPEKGKMLRVRVGPFARVEEMNKVRNELAANGIQATVVKTKEGGN
jgi:cell division septation protein DedD